MREIAHVLVQDLMSKPPITVTPETTLDALTELTRAHDCNGFPVVNQAGILQGVVTRLDLFKIYLLPYRTFLPDAAALSSVGAIMRRGVITLDPRDTAERAIELMVEHRARTLPVVTDGPEGKRVVGVVTRRNLAAALRS